MSFKRKAIVILLILVLPLLIFIGSFAAYTIQRQNDQLSESAGNTLSYYQNAFEMHRTFLLIWRIYCPSTMTFSSSATADPI